MAHVRIAGRDGGETQVSQDMVDRLRARLHGPLLARDDDGYDGARALWNGMIDKRPALIARCRGAADVADAVRFAREHDLLLSVRGGGHNIAGTAVCEGGLMIDLSPMKSVRIEPGGDRVRVEPGCVWADVDRETLPHGRAVPSGIVSATGVAGLTLGGGFGWLTRKYGLTCDSLRSADVVTADGELVRASTDENPELFWALRGGGGNFGIVTSFELEARRHGPMAACGLVVHPFEDALEVARFFREFTESAPDEVTSLFAIRTAPPKPFLPEEVHGKTVAILGACYAGDPDEGMKVLEPVKRFGNPLGDVLAPKPFDAHQAVFNAAQPDGRRYYWKSEYTDAYGPDLAEVLARHTAELPGPHCALLSMHLGGAASRPPEETAAGHRDAGYVLNIAGAWDDPADDDRCTAWARAFHRDIQPFSRGVYVNFLTEDEGTDRVRAAYPDAIWKRLVDVKRRYDPDNVFRSNKNIDPS